jgi:hypothetical protein
LAGILTSSDRLPRSTDQDAAHFLVYRKGFQGNDRAPCTRAPERSLSYRDLNLGRGTFCQNPDKTALPLPREADEKLDKPRVVLGDGTRSTVQRSVQFRYRRWDIARMMKELDLNKMHETWFGGSIFSLTEVPARIGTWMSKMMIRAVKAEASSTTGALGEHNTLPTSR